MTFRILIDFFQFQDFFGDVNDYDIVLKNAGYLGVKYTGKTWLKDTLSQHTLVLQLTHIIENVTLMNEHYKGMTSVIKYVIIMISICHVNAVNLR